MSKERVLIITSFNEFLAGYSLTGIVQDQLRMFTSKGHKVDLIVNEMFKGESFPGVNIKPILPFTHLYDYMTIQEFIYGLSEDNFKQFRKGCSAYKDREDMKDAHHDAADATTEMLIEEAANYDVVLTHDLIFTGWHLPYGLGIRNASQYLRDNPRWFHWVHSIPTGNRDYWDIKAYGHKSRIVFPNATDMVHVAEQFKGFKEHVRCIPHLKDMRSFGNFDELTNQVIDKMPGLMNADITQLYPASVDRLTAKGVEHVINIFAAMKDQGKSVCLLIANQWATTRQRKEDIKGVYDFAEVLGLKANVDFAFMSEIMPKHEVGVPLRTIRELFSLTNLMIFPTREESFGLITPEAALTGNFLVLNRSLQQQYEVGGGDALFFDFGSYRNEHTIENPEAYYRDLARIIIGRMSLNEAVQTRTYARKRYNWDSLYREYYSPLFAESVNWDQMSMKQALVDNKQLQNLIDRGLISVEVEDTPDDGENIGSPPEEIEGPGGKLPKLPEEEEPKNMAMEVDPDEEKKKTELIEGLQEKLHGLEEATGDKS